MRYQFFRKFGVGIILVLSIGQVHAANVTTKTLSSQGGAIFWTGDVGIGSGKSVDIVSFSSRPVFQILDYYRVYEYEYDYYAWTGANRDAFVEVFPFGNESTSMISARYRNGSLYGFDFPEEFSEIDYFDQQQSPLAEAFLYGGFVVTQQNYRYSLLDALSADGEDFTATITTYTDVPEPATWAMMIAGIGAIGGSLRRRKVSPAVTYG